MAATDYSAVFGGAGNKSPSGIIDALEKRGIYVVADAEDSRQLAPGKATYLIFQARVFRFDAADSLTVHDGTTCLVTSDGKRFKADGWGGAQARFYAVQTKNLATPPGSPALGQTWIVATGGTGAWAGKDKYFAVWTARGWVFVVPNAYDLAMVIDAGQIFNFSAAGAWVSGMPAVTIGDKSISPAKFKYAPFGLTVINQITNTPPSAPADGDAYVVGGSPTGAWASLARNVVIWEASAWVAYAPYNGAAVYDASLGAGIVYKAAQGIWTSNSGYAALALGAPVQLGPVGIGFSYTQAMVAAAVSQTSLIHGVNYQAKKAGAILEISVVCDYAVFSASATVLQNGYTFGPLCFDLFVDGGATAVAEWACGQATVSPGSGGVNIAGICTFNFFTSLTTADALLHAYNFRARIALQAGGVATGAVNSITINNLRINIKELS